MRPALKSFLSPPRITVRRMMIYVALSALALQATNTLPPFIKAVTVHWDVCNFRAAWCRGQAASCRQLSTDFPGDTPIPEFCLALPEEYRRTGNTVMQEALYYEAAAKNYESARWRPWVGIPAEPPPWNKSKAH
jgi:hypothetical protein